MPVENGMRFLQKSQYEDINDLKQDEVVKDDDLILDLNYITHRQVGKKRKKLFAAKILYQNQLSCLKEKGRRLILCQQIDREARR